MQRMHVRQPGSSRPVNSSRWFYAQDKTAKLPERALIHLSSVSKSTLWQVGEVLCDEPQAGSVANEVGCSSCFERSLILNPSGTFRLRLDPLGT